MIDPPLEMLKGWDFMKIKIKDIRPEGIEITDAIQTSAIGLTKDDILQFIAPLDVSANVRKIENEVLVQTSIRGRYASLCGRCLEKIERDWSGDFSFHIPIDRDTEFIELDEDIRQEVILNVPARVLCREDCRGICLHCGADLNHEECRCSISHKDTKSQGHNAGDM